MIRHEGSKWVLYSKDGSKVLGRFDNEAAAKKHEQEVQYFKHQEGSMKDKVVAVSIIALEEASYDAASNSMRVTIIRPGFNKSKSRFYPQEVLKRDHKIFEGSRMFLNHATDKQAKERPEGDLRDWVASLSEVRAEGDGRLTGKATFADPSFQERIGHLNKVGLLPQMGVSIRASGDATQKKVDGVNTTYVEALHKARSVDFVTFAGAGGQIEAMEAEEFEAAESEQENQNNMDQLAQALEQLATAKAKIVAVEAENVTLKTQVTALETKFNESAKVAAKASTAVKVAEAIKDSKLPKSAKEKLAKQFSEAEKFEGVKEAIEAEEKYVAELTGGKVRNMGTEENGDTDKESKINLAESFAFLGMDKSKAERAGRI